MPGSILVTGGCRSGKSRHALKLAEDSGETPNLFLATCVPGDDEMKARVQRHQQERGHHWQTLEIPVEIPQAILHHGKGAGVMVIDCLTLWISNLMTALDDDKQIEIMIKELGKVLTQPPCTIILVTNEVGCGVVPANALSRRFRDLVGWCNQQLAAQCHQVIWMVSGIAVPIKPSCVPKGLA